MKSLKKILIIGAEGEIGSYLFKEFKKSSFDIYGTSRRKLNNSKLIKFDLIDNDFNFDLADFQACIICAGLSNISDIEKNSKYSEFINVLSTIKLIKECKKKNIFLIYLSSVAVFNGRKSFYKITDSPCPFNNYGKYKLEIEDFISNYYFENYAILRLTKVISFNTPLIRKWRELYKLNKNIKVFEDKFLSPISLDKVFVTLNLILKEKLYGIFHLGGKDEISFYEFALKYFNENDLSNKLVKPVIFNENKQIYNGKFSSLHNSFT